MKFLWRDIDKVSADFVHKNYGHGDIDLMVEVGIDLTLSRGVTLTKYPLNILKQCWQATNNNGNATGFDL